MVYGKRFPIPCVTVGDVVSLMRCGSVRRVSDVIKLYLLGPGEDIVITPLEAYRQIRIPRHILVGVLGATPRYPLTGCHIA